MARTRINGTQGNDLLDEDRFGESDIFGFAGNDTIRLLRDDDLGGDNFVNAGVGNDQVLNQFEGGNFIQLGAGNDLYAGTGFTFETLGFDTVHAGTGNDTIAVSTFFSDYFGEGGNDTFISEGWSNLFNGGFGSDTADYRFRTDNSIFAGSPLAIDLGQGKVFTGTSRVETLVSVENAVGSRLGDQMFGSAANNRLDGFQGNDAIAGLRGGDTLLGGAGADTMDGGAGGDTLNGQQGSDLMAGGAGADRFVFNTAPAAGNIDTIADFTPGADKLQLDDAVFGGLSAATLDRIVYDSASGGLFFDADAAGPGAARQFAVVGTGLALTTADFEVI